MITNRITDWWKTRNHLEKWLSALLSFSLLVCIALILSLIGSLPCSSHEAVLINANKDIQTQGGLHSIDESLVCVTPGCISIAAEYLRKANLSADPCNNFYNFACGQYEADSAIPDEETPFTNAENDMNYRLKTILDNRPNGYENEAFGKVRSYYNACKNTTEINRLKERPLQDVLQKLGGWPVVEGEKWSSEGGENFEWAETIYKMRKLGAPHNFLVELSVAVDYTNSSTYMIQVNEPTFGMTTAYFLEGINATFVQEYLKLMINTAVLLGADRHIAEAELTAALEFEIQLANLSLIVEDRNGIITLGDLQLIAPMVDWVEYANQLLMDNVDENETILAMSSNYLEQLTVLLLETPKRTVANYLMWRVVLSVISTLDDRFRSNWLAYYSAVTGRTGDNSRWFTCLTYTKSAFINAVGAMYVRRYLDKNARDLTSKLVSDVREEFLSILKNVDWMDSIALDRTLKKAKAMIEMTAYPLQLLNDTALEDKSMHGALELILMRISLRQISVKENKFLEYTLHISKVWLDYNYGNLHKFHDRTDWRDKQSVTEVNAFYYQSENLIMIPAGILQGIFFGSDRPRYVNYGAVGSLIGHEITHGFDNQGRQFDEVGNLEEWWNTTTESQFKTKAECIIDQYSHYYMETVNMTINGTQTQSENIADNGGVKAAYGAYRKWESNNYVEKSLPGLNFTTWQLFWISFANIWCMKTTPEATKVTLLTDIHSPPMFRVNGVISNSPAFSKDFNCPTGSPMNPERKCAVW